LVTKLLAGGEFLCPAYQRSW